EQHDRARNQPSRAHGRRILGSRCRVHRIKQINVQQYAFSL
ncbi:MAG: hypothetical protein AVDCRST_MAG93-3901, partial [uncultured Chloroflexia bacterium]